MGAKPRLLAVGGFHVFDETPARCTFVDVRPPAAVHQLGWTDVLAFEASLEGAAELRCGEEAPIVLEIVAPVRMHVKPDDDVNPASIGVGECFGVQATLYDGEERELEVGRFTTLEWSCSSLLEPAIDRSAGEFGFCDTCYGRYAFRATDPGPGWISAVLGGLRDTLQVAIASRTDV
jgi:hypothetical protein